MGLAGRRCFPLVPIVCWRDGRNDSGDGLPCGILVTRAPSMGTQPGDCSGGDCVVPSVVGDGTRNLHAVGAASYGVRGRISTDGEAGLVSTPHAPTRSTCCRSRPSE